MKKLLVLFFLFFLTTTAYADDFTLAGYLKNEFALGLDTFNDIHKVKNVLSLSGEYRINDEWTFFASTKYWYDLVYDWYEKYDPAQRQMGHIQRSEWLRDCYFDYITDMLDIRLGKQQVAWGQADGITILDRVNPLNLSEFWLPDFTDVRIPLWMVNIKYAPKVNSILQLLVIPDFEQSTSAPAGAPFAFKSVNDFDAFKQAVGPSNVSVISYYPAKRFDNSTIGLQWLDRIGELEYTLNYLYGYYYSGRTFTEAGLWKYSRRFKRWQLYGGSFNRTFTGSGLLQGITLRGDFAYYNNEPTYIGTEFSRKNTVGWDNIFWLIGADKYIATNWQASVQFSQYILQDSKEGQYYPLNAYTYGFADQVENIFTVKLMTDFMRERLKTEVLWSATDDNQGRLSPKLTYEMRDDLWLTAGFHYFYGNEGDTNGQFRDKNQIYLHLTYTF